LSGDRDVMLAGVASMAALSSLSFALWFPHQAAPRDEGEVVASVRQATRGLQVRPLHTLGWRGLEAGGDVYVADSVFVPPGGEARLQFPDGTVLELDEKSLVVVEPLRAGTRQVTLRQGSFTGYAGDAGLAIDTASGTARLSPRTEARLELSGGRVEVQVKKGQAIVGERQLKEGGRALSSGSSVETLPAWPVQLVDPEANARMLFRGKPATMTLSWSGSPPPDARVQVARDRLFAFATELKATGGAAQVDPSPGVSWWRLVGPDGEPLSEARRFNLVEDVSPSLLSPGDGEVVLASPGTKVPFSWTPVPGSVSYKLELSGSRGFEPIATTEQVAGNHVRLPVELAEGSWYWRVSAVRPDLGEGEPSTPSRLRLIHKEIPSAPELLTPEIEVTP
jgi:hypothetical protein